jgi:hypothetical protein
VLLLIERMLPLYHPDVVLYGSTLNDFGGNEVAIANGQAKPRFLLDHDTLHLIPPQLAPDVQPSRLGLRTWLQNSAFYRVLQPRIFTLRARVAGWQQRNLMGLMQEVYVDPSALDEFDWPLFSGLIQRMQRSCEAAGARFFLFSHPEVAEVWPPYIETIRQQFGATVLGYDALAAQHRVERTAQADGIDFIETAPRFQQHGERGPFHLLPYDAHLNAAGHRLLAEVLADELLARGIAAPARH